MTEKQLHLNSVITRNPEIIHNSIDDEVVIMSIAKNNFYGMDEIASNIWELLEKPIRIEEIVAIMMQNYNVDQETCERDVIDFLNEGLKHELITIKN